VRDWTAWFFDRLLPSRGRDDPTLRFNAELVQGFGAFELLATGFFCISERRHFWFFFSLIPLHERPSEPRNLRKVVAAHPGDVLVAGAGLAITPRQADAWHGA
jgi:hypothetical protein